WPTLATLLIALACPTSLVQAQATAAPSLGSGAPDATLNQVVETTLATNPQIISGMQTFQAAIAGQQVGAGALRPEVNLQSQIGHDWRANTPDNASMQSWNRLG